MVAHARAKVERAGLQDRIEIRMVEPGPMPLPDAGVDIVFSKDSIVHMPDKEALAADAFRVLKPGGWFVASDWLISHDGEPSPEMADYIAREDLDFGMASPERYRRALEAAGFVDVSLTNRNPWYRDGCARGAGAAGWCGQGRLPGGAGRGGAGRAGGHLARDDRGAGFGRALPAPLPGPKAVAPASCRAADQLVHKHQHPEIAARATSMKARARFTASAACESVKTSAGIPPGSPVG